MTAIERYTVFLKALGIWTVVAGLLLFPTATLQLHAFNDSTEFFYMLMGSVATPVIMVLAGYGMLFWTDWLVQITCANVEQSTGDDLTNQPPASSDSGDLLAALLKTLGFWSSVMGTAALPDWLARIHDRPVGLFYLWMTGPGMCAALIVCGVVLVFSTSWFAQMPALGATSSTDVSGGNSRAKELFMATVKTISAWLVIDGVSHLPATIAKLWAAYLDLPEGVAFGTLLQVLAKPLLPLGLGIWLFFGTMFFVRLAFSIPTTAASE